MKSRPAKTSFWDHSKISAKKMSFILGGVLLLLIGIIALFPLLDGETDKYEATTYAMNGYVQQTVYGKNGEAAAVQAADAVQALEDRISWRITDSEVLDLNSRAGETWKVLSEDVFSVLATAQDVAEQSGGAFDVTIAPVSRLWDFDSERHEIPDAEAIASMLENVGYKNLRLNADERSASLKYYGTAVDLTAVQTGAACDAAVKQYVENDITAAVISVGDSIGLYGKKPSGTLWNIAVRDPQSADALGVLSLDSGFLSTVDNTRGAFTENGVTYHATLDPKTGCPADSGLISVTVLSDSGTLSDALAAACFVLGQDDSLPLLSAYNAEAVFVRADSTVAVTDGLKSRFTLEKDGYTLYP